MAVTPDTTTATATTTSTTYDPFPKFGYSGALRPAYPLSKNKRVPPSIVRPNYAREEFMSSRNIRINTPTDIAGVRLASSLAREVLCLARDAIKPGVTTDAIDKVVFRGAVARDCYPSPLGYHGYPKSVCTSLNEVICHGIPDGRPLREGDVINIDVTLYHKGYHGDLNATWVVGPEGVLPSTFRSPHSARDLASNEEEEQLAQRRQAETPDQKLIRVARECLDRAIAICGPGVPYAEVGKVIQPHAEENGFAVVKNYTGHGVGKVFHGAPTVFHHKTKQSWGVMAPGHIFTIEPMLSATPPPTGCKDLSWPDDWTVTTTDGAHSAAAEETLLITDVGVEVLTAEGGRSVNVDTREQRRRAGLLRDEVEEQVV